MIPARITPIVQQQPDIQAFGEKLAEVGMPWVDQLNANMLHTVQALHRLHTAFDQKFTRSPSAP